MEEELKRDRDGLEKKVSEVTQDLLKAREKLENEIAERTIAEKRLRESEELYLAILSNISDAVIITDDRGGFTYLGPRVGGVLGYSADELRGLGNIESLFGASFLDIALLRSLGEIQNVECRVKDKTGREHVLLINVKLVSAGEGKVLYTCRDITARKRILARLDLAAKMIEGSNEAIVLTDPHATIIDVNEAFCQVTGYPREELLGHNPRILKSGRHGAEFYEHMWKSLLSEGHWQGEIWDRRKNGEIYPKLLSISVVKNDYNEITHFVGFSSDISKIKQTEERLEHLAHYDPLTGLANRILFRDRLNRAIAEARRHEQTVALMVLDLDRFKNINDTMGHPTGDQLLVDVAVGLQGCVREIDTVARLGGDEFAVVLPELSDKLIVSNLGHRILKALSAPFNLRDREVHISSSIGIALFPDDGSDVDKLIQHADTALYNAKEKGRNNFQFFSQEMNLRLQETSELELALRLALEQNGLDLHYQPVVDFGDGRIVGVEALLRWDHSTRGAISPTKAIPLAEETGLIHPLGEWVLRSACRQNRTWQLMGLPPLRMAVNVSGHQLTHPEFAQTVSGILNETGLEPKWLELELTETVAMRNVESTMDVFRRLKEIGVGVIIDDFGTGYSSLSYLKRFPIDKLKIDRSFVKDVTSYHDNEPIVRAIIGVAHSLGLKVVAEGIERKQQVLFLWSLDCDEWQGYFFSRPVPADELTRLLQEGRRALSLDFRRSQDLQVDVEKINGEHRQWFRCVDALCRSILAGSARDQLSELTKFLADYSRFHFTEEESLMAVHDYPGIGAQKKAHEYLLARVQDIAKKVETGEVTDDLLVEVVSELYGWFMNHIDKMDRPLADYLQSISKDSTAATEP